MNQKQLMVGCALLCLLGAYNGVSAYAADSEAYATAQQNVITVTGTVVDANGEPLIGVAVMQSNTNGAVTDLDGKYSISVPSDATLTFSSIGYTTQEVQVSGRTTIDVTLTTDVEFLDDVVVVGYGVQKKATLTGSISAVNGDELKKVSAANMTNTLAGKTAGVIAYSRSGEPGADDATILIRGKGTFSNDDGSNVAPLIVVDGVAGREFSRLNPEDIESISVLKDASAAIYGARAANGVILVTTKRGKDGKVTLNYNGSYSMSQPTRVPKMLDAYDYATYVNEYDAQERHAQSGLTYTDEVMQHYKNNDDPVTYPNTNWWKSVAKNWSSKTQHSVSVSGGNEKLSFYTSAQYMYQDALYKNAAQNYNQIQFVSNVDAKISNAIRMSMDVLGRRETRNQGGSSTSSIYTYFLTTFPGAAPYYPNGLPRVGYDGVTNNAAIMVTDIPGYSKTHNNTLTLKPLLHIDLDAITKGLYVEGYAAVDMNFEDSRSLSKPYDLYLYDATTGEYNSRRSATGVISVSNSASNSLSFTLHGRVGYERTFNDVHHFTAFAAYEQNQYRYHYLSAGRTNYLSDTIPELFAGSDDPEDLSNYGYSNATSRVNVFGRINYDYKSKYLLEATLRYDGSMNFEKSHRWGLFPSFSAGWVLSEESFWENIKPYVGFFKLKASWGMMGNDYVDAYQYMSQYKFSSAGVTFGSGDSLNQAKALYLDRLANPKITWETAKTTNVGFVANFLQKFSLEGDYFFSRRSDILYARSASVPSYSGLSLPDENLGIVDNQGVEFVGSYRDSKGDLSWGVTGNITWAENKVKYIDEAEDTPDWQRQEGYPIDSQLIYKAVKIYQTQDEIDNSATIDENVTPGDLQYVDTDEDGVITANDMVRINRTATPKIVYGITLNGGWKGLDLNVFFQGQAQAKTLFMPTMNMVQEYFDGRYVESDASTHATAKYPKALIKQTYCDNWNGKYSTWWLRNTAFLRLKSVELGYTLPKSIVNKISVENLRVYVSGTNLFTIDSFKVADPEVGSITEYPLQRMINFGVNLTF